jgi:hypothetical protein
MFINCGSVRFPNQISLFFTILSAKSSLSTRRSTSSRMINTFFCVERWLAACSVEWSLSQLINNLFVERFLLSSYVGILQSFKKVNLMRKLGAQAYRRKETVHIDIGYKCSNCPPGIGIRHNFCEGTNRFHVGDSEISVIKVGGVPCDGKRNFKWPSIGLRARPHGSFCGAS